MARLAKSPFVIAVATAASSLWVIGVYAGNTTCASGQLDWYTSVVGETPCDTYQRLRRICNPDYEVPNFRPNTPGDQCDDQVSACCCNTVAFQLSMLCMNCQYDTVNGDISSGIDAGVGAYNLYKRSCGAGTNHSLPADIQKAVCNENIRLDDILYNGWDDGSWFYVFTKQTASKDHAATNNNTFTHCPDQNTSSSSTPTALHSNGVNSAEITLSSALSDTLIPTAAADNPSTVPHSSHGSNAGTIVGACLGAAAGVLLLCGLFMFWRLRRNRKIQAELLRSRPMSYSGPSHGLGSVLPSSSIGPCHSETESLKPSSSLKSDGRGSLDCPGHTTEPWARRMSSYNTSLSTVASMESLRHEDAGLIELFRSASGRLPPAYRSWGNHEYMFGPGVETQDSELQESLQRVGENRHVVPDLPPLPTRPCMPDTNTFDRHAPLVPLRRVPTQAYR